MKLQEANQNKKSTAISLLKTTLLRIGVYLLASLALVTVLFPVSYSPLAPTVPLLEKAQASGAWPTPSPSLSVSLGFKQTYEFDNKVYTHCGIDIASDAGSQVCSPVQGTISFIGDVPASDSAATFSSSEKTMRAISVALSDGRNVTLMPIEKEIVSKGQSVSEGQVLASLAATGDRSLSVPHLHMGLKRGNVYYDPLTLFGMSSSSQNSAAQNEEGALDTTGVYAQNSNAEALEGLSEELSALNGAEGLSGQESGIFAGDIAQPDAILQPQADYGSITSGDPSIESLKNGTENTFSPLSWLSEFGTSLTNSCISQMQSLYGAFQYLSEISGLPVMVFAIGCAVLIVGILSAACYCFVRFILPQLRKRCGFSKIKSCTKESGVVG